MRKIIQAIVNVNGADKLLSCSIISTRQKVIIFPPDDACHHSIVMIHDGILCRKASVKDGKVCKFRVS